MFSLAYVILPFSGRPPAEAIRDSLAPFRRGTRGDLPDDWLAFHDETAHVRRLHEAAFVFTDEGGGGGLRVEGGEVWHLDDRAIRAEMARRGLRRWAVRFADAEEEPDLGCFFDRFVAGLERHPADAARFGRWLNPLGRWDWWDLGGRFDGRILGERGRRRGRAASAVSSGPSAGRAVLGNLHAALDRALGAEPAAEFDARADGNTEVVSRLLEDARAGLDHAVPGAVLLPPGSVADGLRWLDSWPRVGPAGGLAWLGLSAAAPWEAVVVAAYARFADHWAAGVAYHH